MGHHKAALTLLEQDPNHLKSFELCLAKAHILITMGRAEEACKVLDATQQETPYQKYNVFQTLAKAFLLNNEPKSA